MFRVQVTTEVVTELVTLADVKDHLNITHSDADTYLTGLITKARKAMEKYTGKGIGSQSVTWLFDACSSVEYPLPVQPVVSITSVHYKNALDVYELATVVEDYELDGITNSDFKPLFNGRWKIVFVTGYTTIPEELKHAILIQCAYWYENRGEQGDGLCEASRTAAKGFKDYSWL